MQDEGVGRMKGVGRAQEIGHAQGDRLCVQSCNENESRRQ